MSIDYIKENITLNRGLLFIAIAINASLAGWLFSSYPKIDNSIASIQFGLVALVFITFILIASRQLRLVKNLIEEIKDAD